VDSSGFSLELFDQFAHDRPGHEQWITLRVYAIVRDGTTTHCADVKRFQTVDDIDKQGVKVIANPGGSNERFARANFKTAKLTRPSRHPWHLRRSFERQCRCLRHRIC